MCVLTLAWRTHPHWHLILAGNRDELHTRQAAPLARWALPDDVIAGKDLQLGGTWLGVSGQGRLAVVTNLRGYGAPEPNRASRGALVTDLLSGQGRYADPHSAQLLDFNPFNLIMVDRGQAQFLSNRPEVIRTPLVSGIFGLSNGTLDEPWPKTMRLKTILRDWITEDASHPEALLDGLREEEVPDAGLLSVIPSDVPLEPPPSAIFICNPVYGTRCSTVVAIDNQGQGVILERRFSPTGKMTGETALPFSWPS